MRDIEVVALKLKLSPSGVTTTVIRLLPISEKMIGIRTTKAFEA